MRMLLTLIVLSASVPPALLAAGNVKASVVSTEERYCIADADVGWLEIQLRVQLLNKDGNAIMVWAPGGQINLRIEQLVVAKSEKDLANRKYELNMPLLYADQDISSNDQAYGAGEFLLIKGKESREVKTFVRIPYARPNGSGQSAGLANGSHYVFLYFGLWPESSEKARKVTSSLKLPAAILTGPLRSNAIKVDVPSIPNEEKCWDENR